MSGRERKALSSIVNLHGKRPKRVEYSDKENVCCHCSGLRGPPLDARDGQGEGGMGLGYVGVAYKQLTTGYV